ncbi:hypothetical protein FACS1894102_5370 [Spirochaetia bacterium]|nr:hypothetical protein FACS1894102_5370 [Spirochaetia bacterium]
MTIGEMFGQSGVLVLLGMFVVFSFLAILIVSITGLGAIVHKLGWDKEKSPTNGAKTATSGAVIDASVIAAIGASVKQYRKK